MKLCSGRLSGVHFALFWSSDNETSLIYHLELNIFSGSNCEKLELDYLTFTIRTNVQWKNMKSFLYPSFNTGFALAVALFWISAWPTSILVQHWADAGLMSLVCYGYQWLALQRCRTCGTQELQCLLPTATCHPGWGWTACAHITSAPSLSST